MNEQKLLNKLNDKLDNNLAWRKKEITDLFLHIEGHYGDLQISLIRGTITLLYAHWEGFVKFAAKEYLTYICGLDYDLQRLTENFSHITLSKKFPNNEISTKNYTWQKKIFDYILLESKNEKFSVDPNATINVKSNLTYQVLEEIFYQLGFDINFYETKKNLLNNMVIELRNPIAHGERRSNQKIKEDFLEMKEQILVLLDKFKELVIDASENKKFLRVS